MPTSEFTIKQLHDNCTETDNVQSQIYMDNWQTMIADRQSERSKRRPAKKVQSQIVQKVQSYIEHQSLKTRLRPIAITMY